MSILYRRYHDAREEGMSTDKFIIDFTDRYLLDMTNSKWRFMPDGIVTKVEVEKKVKGKKVWVKLKELSSE